ncbi:Aliphatic amidase expression-regulating protein [Planctomycetes bacterium Pan216]|uniref:Aliphatic amidase expression-regulating protein n=1 Tax=Kolteria novifilia TaxID=2527975 RepID=A0A518B4D6_9BACT|nr:Aliphatic amidase expression-regulating protein [Planctomycetes bacterium Pan216]
MRWIILLVTALFVAGVGVFALRPPTEEQAPIKVGILHSKTGTMAISEASMIDAEVMALEEINRQGGILGRPIEWSIKDGESDWPTYAERAEELITEDGVCTIFGCWTSASRKTVKPVVEKHDHLLIYPMAYEGLEQSKNIVYTGAAPNQQITPAVRWSFDNLGKTFFLVGSDYIWPHSVNEIAKDQIKAIGGEVVGEEYLLLGSTNVDAIVRKIRDTKPAVVLSTVVGDSNLAFYTKLRAAGVDPKTSPVVSMSIAEDELRVLPVESMAGNYVAWNYLQGIDRDENREFIKRFRERYGQDRVTSDVIEAAYFSVYLWAQAVADAESDDTDEVRRAILRQSFNSPEGVVSIDSTTQHTWKIICIGQIEPDGSIEVVYQSPKPIRPVPYPVTRSIAEWDAFVEGLHEKWGGQWANPGGK